MASVAWLVFSGCYTQLKHSEPSVVYTEEEAPVSDDPHAGLAEVAPPRLRVSVDRPSYWISHGEPTVVTIENYGDVPAILDGAGGVPDIYLEEWVGRGWQFVMILNRQYPSLTGGSPPPSLAPGAVTSQAHYLPRWGRLRAGVKQLSGDPRSDLLIFSEPFDVWR